MSDFVAAEGIKGALIADGWLSPDTYCKHYEPIEPVSSVYIFMLYGDDMLTQAMVAYVGQTADLKRRFSKHNVLPLVRQSGVWVQRWFKPTEKPALRKTEAGYIKKFDPPWNIIGRSRGISK